jgi:regulator of replication initiation timing
MIDKKPPDSEIVKALECCNKYIIKRCMDCPLLKTDRLISCEKRLGVLSLDLINRLQSNNQNSSAGSSVSSLLDTINNLTLERSNLIAENNRLQAENERLKNDLAISKKETKRYMTGYKTAKAEAYKECIEKVKERLAVHSFTSNSTEYTDGMLDCMEWVDSKIEELKKELVGEDK